MLRGDSRHAEVLVLSKINCKSSNLAGVSSVGLEWLVVWDENEYLGVKSEKGFYAKRNNLTFILGHENFIGKDLIKGDRWSTIFILEWLWWLLNGPSERVKVRTWRDSFKQFLEFFNRIKSHLVYDLESKLGKLQGKYIKNYFGIFLSVVSHVEM